MSNLEEAKKFLRDKARQQGDHMRGCTSYVSRMLSCGYNRAARILEELVEQQFITDADERGERRLLPMTSPDPLAPTATPTEARTPMPGTTEPAPLTHRNMVEAIERVRGMTDKEIRLFARHDPDIFRDVARVASARIGWEKYQNPACEDCLKDEVGSAGICTMNCSSAGVRRALTKPSAL